MEPLYFSDEKLTTVKKWEIYNDASHQLDKLSSFPTIAILECYMGWFPSLICKNYIFKDFVKTIEATSLKFCMILKLRTLHPKKTTAQVKFANCSNAHAQTFILLNGEMAIVSACFRKLKVWLWLLWTVFFLMQTGFLKIGLNKLS